MKLKVPLPQCTATAKKDQICLVTQNYRVHMYVYRLLNSDHISAIKIFTFICCLSHIWHVMNSTALQIMGSDLSFEQKSPQKTPAVQDLPLPRVC